MKNAFLFLVFYILVIGVNAQNLQRKCWHGKISAGVSVLAVNFNIVTDADGTRHCTMDVPAQGAKGVPALLLKDDADSLCISIPVLRASYAGFKVSPTGIEGHFRQNGMVLELNLTPGKAEPKRPQTPHPPYPYRTEEVLFDNEEGDAQLAGTLTYPVGYGSEGMPPVPVVLMVTGSGTQDRDEELFGHRPFLVIADHLARHGIATLRYDDRGAGRSTGPLQGITTQDYLSDALSGIKFLKGLGIFSSVGVLGHSEGGTIAFMMGGTGSVDFIVSLAGSAIQGMDVLIGQNRAIMQMQGVPVPTVEHYAKALELLYVDRISGKSVPDAVSYAEHLCRSNGLVLPPSLQTNLAKCYTAGGEWMTWFLRYDPAADISRTVCPVLALNGSLDMQVLSSDNLGAILRHLPHNPKSVVREYDSLNHLFQHCTPATSMNYGGMEQTISPKVLEDMVEWIRSL